MKFKFPWMFLGLLLCLVGVAAIAGCDESDCCPDAPGNVAPADGDTISPDPEPVPAPAPDPDPEPAPEPLPAPVTDPVTDPVADPDNLSSI